MRGKDRAVISHDDIDKAAEALMGVAAATAHDLAMGDVGGEEDFSGQLIGRCKQKLEDLHTSNVRWSVGAAVTESEDGPAQPSVRFSARQTTSKGGRSEESWSGADLLLVL